jgi:acyl-CoA hydrolase
MVVGLKIESENIKSGVFKHCNSSYFTMVAKDDAGKSVPVPGLILNTEESIRRFARSISRQKQASQRNENFSKSSFQLEEHIQKIENQNAKIELI